MFLIIFIRSWLSGKRMKKYRKYSFELASLRILILNTSHRKCICRAGRVLRDTCVIWTIQPSGNGFSIDIHRWCPVHGCCYKFRYRTTNYCSNSLFHRGGLWSSWKGSLSSEPTSALAEAPANAGSILLIRVCAVCFSRDMPPRRTNTLITSRPSVFLYWTNSSHW